MTSIFIVIVGFLYDGIVRGRENLFKGRLNSCKSFFKGQIAHYYPIGSPFSLKILNFWPVLYPGPSGSRCNCEDWIHWVSHLRVTNCPFGLESRPIPPPPGSSQIWAFCPIR